ncbi:cupin domain-containing protein [Flavobacterium flavipallidum]|uniref:Cupin domain-containing protein n=1 Tax=Flavobacterium flavipallidum TaxID=3139140 RepID=A0ABU9HJ01_9FLAO
MKRSILVEIGSYLFFLLCHFNLSAQMMRMDNMGRELANSKLIHASEMILEPGKKTIMHTHPAHFYYALTDVNLKVSYQDGKVAMYKMKAGESGVSEPERPHVTQNVGSKTAKFLVVELKEHPYKPSKSKK